jgi:putative YpdA family bacillithiol system oxidoreductase
VGIEDILKVSFEFSPKLGVRQLPKLHGNYESSVKGLHIVGDLADAPIIKVAINQGYDVAAKIAEELKEPGEGEHDVVIIGAGPAGIGAALALRERGLRYVILEKEMPFATIQNFPKNKLIFSEPKSLESKGNLWFEDAQKEELIETWEQALDDHSLDIRQPEEVVDVQRAGGGLEVKTRSGSYSARRVILAIGRRGSVNKLKIPGEELDKVAYALKDPAAHAGRKVLVVGGGDSAVEAATACAEAGADVTVSYRKDAFVRAKAKNREKIDAMIAAGQLRAELGTTPTEILEDKVRLKRGDETLEVPNDDVLIFAGTKLPAGFLSKVGIVMEGALSPARVAWILSFAAMTYLFYVLKTKRTFFPFGPEDPLGMVPGLLKVQLPIRAAETDGGFWGTLLYATLIVVFGVRAYKRWPSPTQKKRYISLVTYQVLFLFAIPELLAPLVIDRGYKLYGLFLPWPLNIWGWVDAPGWVPGDSPDKTAIAIAWIGVGLVATFVLVPLYVRFNGTRFCSYLCGCGGLAETLGDQWRHLAPRGLTSYKAEWAGKLILAAALPVTLLIVNDAWQFFAAGSLYDAKTFAQNWYGLVVDFWLASVVGVAFYPYLGNRVWCRFFCPLRAYMEVLSRWFSKITIKANDKCIGCGECTRFCQMGIQVQSFAQRLEDMDNTNSSCIQCGICIQVCPMEVLSIGERGRALPVVSG